MKNCCLTLLALVFLLVTAAGSVPAQDTEQTCVIVLKGQNQNRTVAGAVNEECGDDWHTAPWGNWGVASNYGDITDTDQFPGWKHLDGPPTKKQWNSCTTQVPEFRAPNCTYYNASEGITGCMTQRSYGIATHGQMSYQLTPEACDPDVPGATPPTYIGCQEQGSVGQTSNYTTLYELDWDGNDLVETLYFPGISVTLTGCDHDGCPEKPSGWVDMTSSTSSSAVVEAELRMKASAYLQGSCDWNW